MTAALDSGDGAEARLKIPNSAQGKRIDHMFARCGRSVSRQHSEREQRDEDEDRQYEG
jgi:hypothetical protein